MSEFVLPEGWSLTSLGEIADWGSGGTPSRKTESYYGGTIPWVKTGDLGPKILTQASEFITKQAVANSSAKFFPKGSVAIAMYGATIGKTSILGIDATTNQACGVGNPIKGITFTEFLYYMLCNEKHNFIAKGKGGAQPNISQALIKEHEIGLPPLAEQQQIALKLDELLAQVDILKARLDAIPKILKRFRQSVLSAAVSGKLTEEWRGNQELDDAHAFYCSKVNLPNEYKRGGKQAVKGTIDLNTAWLPVLPTKWTYRTVDELYHTNHLFEYVDGNHGSLYPLKSDFSDAGILFVTASQIGEGSEIAWGEVPRLNKNKAGILVKGWSMAGDVLLTHNATVGRTAIVPDSFNEKFLLGTSVTLYRTSDSYIVRKYLYYFFNSRMWQSQLESVMGQTTRNQVSITKQALMQVALPPTKEQTEIVRRVEQLFAYADQIEQRVKDAQARVNHLTQSILAKAFRGELTAEWRAQNPELISGENSAAALLEKIKAERNATVKPKRKVKA